jgi:hypothetical protein
MTWTTPRDLVTQLARLWDKGALLRPIVTGEATFPLRLKLKAPASRDLTDNFPAVRAWGAELGAMPHIRIGWHQVRHSVQGFQTLPHQVWVDTLDDALTLLRKRQDAECYGEVVEQTKQRMPELVLWLADNPLRALDLAPQWARLLAVVNWLLRHPRPGIYLRQVDIPGVDTKFIEAHRAVLSELLDYSLPADAIQPDCSGTRQFARRYGFLDRPTHIRFRVLDPRIQVIAGSTLPDIAIDARNFAGLALPIRNVFITENQTNFLAFPPADHSIAIFGEGYGWSTLAAVQWLKNCVVYYWGDIDTHGFVILNNLRQHFPHVQSLLMNRETLLAHKEHWGEEPSQIRHDLLYLTPEEYSLYNDLRDNRIRRNLRLEQERVAFNWVTRHLALLGEAPGQRNNS